MTLPDLSVGSFILNFGSMFCDKCQHYPKTPLGLTGTFLLPVHPDEHCLGSFLLWKLLFLSFIQVNRWASGWTSTTSRRWRSWRRSRKTRWWTSPRSTKPWKPGFASDMALTFTLTHTPLVSHALTHAHLKHAHALHFPHTHTLPFSHPLNSCSSSLFFVNPKTVKWDRILFDSHNQSLIEYFSEVLNWN